MLTNTECYNTVMYQNKQIKQVAGYQNQYTKNQLCVYTLMINNLKRKLKKKSQLQEH